MPRRTRFRFEPPIYTFRVRILGGGFAPPDGRDIWREIEIAANQALGNLADAIQDAFGFDDPHLWAFFLSGKAWDQSTEYGVTLPIDDDPPERDAYDVLIRDVPYPGASGKKEFLWLFDFGDEWHFGVKLVRTSSELHPTEAYPRLAASHGDAPSQYPPYDEDDDESEGGGDLIIVVP